MRNYKKKTNPKYPWQAYYIKWGLLFNLSNNETFINNDEKSDIKNKFLDFLHKHFKLNRIIVFFGFIAFILNLVSIIVFKNVFSFKVKYNIYFCWEQI